MEAVGLRKMRQNLSHYARRARDGESFVITNRGNAVARLVPTTTIDRLVIERGARRGRGSLLDLLDELPEPIPGPPTEQVLEDLRAEHL